MSDTVAQQIDASADPKPRPEPRFRLADYALLLKPRVMSLVVFTAMVGLVMAPGDIGTWQAFVAILCISLGAGASGAINMWYDRDIDINMRRTMNRPIPAGRMEARNALVFGSVLAVASVIAMGVWVNEISGLLLAVTILYYVFIYTVWLKRRTPQNIVIGGASGALPPVIGWAAVTGNAGFLADPWGALALFMIIFLWTPPHTWALALFRRQGLPERGRAHVARGRGRTGHQGPDGGLHGAADPRDLCTRGHSDVRLAVPDRRGRAERRADRAYGTGLAGGKRRRRQARPLPAHVLLYDPLSVRDFPGSAGRPHPVFSPSFSPI